MPFDQQSQAIAVDGEMFLSAEAGPGRPFH
jgi:hypothetical protein